MKTEFAKKSWVKPEIQTLNIRNTHSGEPAGVPEGQYGTDDGSVS